MSIQSPPPKSLPLRFRDLGLIDYAAAYDLQRGAAQEIEKQTNSPTGIVFLCEHPPVLTIGPLADRNDLGRTVDEWTREGVQVTETDRGGKITFHGPGQIVIYPVINIKKMGIDLHRYIRSLEETGIRFLSMYGVNAIRDPRHTGVWVGDAKIAAIGVHIRHWITTHGMAMNINNSSDMFRRFTPCGIHDKGVISLQEILGAPVDFDLAKRRLLDAFAQIFSAKMIPDSM